MCYHHTYKALWINDLEQISPFCKFDTVKSFFVVVVVCIRKVRAELWNKIKKQVIIENLPVHRTETATV